MNDWEPGDPLYNPAYAGYNSQPMITIKEEPSDCLGGEAARWSPDFGWRNAL